MWNHFLISLEIMGKGMIGIFAAIVIIMLAVMVMGKLAGQKKKDTVQEKEKN